MITKNDVKKLSSLARIELSQTEQEELALEMDSILDFVGQVNSIVGVENDSQNTNINIVNILREDNDSNESGKYTNKILAEMPNVENGYLKVKKIL